jgi:hypothetical protein
VAFASECPRIFPIREPRMLIVVTSCGWSSEIARRARSKLRQGVDPTRP